MLCRERRSGHYRKLWIFGRGVEMTVSAIEGVTRSRARAINYVAKQGRYAA
jgi:predicted lysophospholipase L1 biosynthesis ABC-type transport system permease subunit